MAGLRYALTSHFESDECGAPDSLHEVAKDPARVWVWLLAKDRPSVFARPAQERLGRWAEGQAMTFEQAVEYALRDQDRA